MLGRFALVMKASDGRSNREIPRPPEHDLLTLKVQRTSLTDLEIWLVGISNCFDIRLGFMHNEASEAKQAHGIAYSATINISKWILASVSCPLPMVHSIGH